MTEIVAAQLDPACPPGRLDGWAARRDVRLRVVRVDRGDALPDPVGADGVVVLGSDQSVTRPAAWQPGLEAWTAQAIAADVPVLGVCFGGQLLAHVLGGVVERAPRKEIGWLEIDAADAQIPAGPWLFWHEDRFTPPAGAETLARNEVGTQVFRHGRHLGLQFHPEATADIAAGWARDTGGRALAEHGLDVETIHALATAADAAEGAAADALFDAWWRAG